MSFFIPTAAAGNGLSLATFGRSGEIMGFFYPRIDFAQNVREGMPAVRVVTGSGEAVFLWCFHESWRVAQSFERASNVLITRLTHRDLDLSLEISDCLPPGEHALLRRVVVRKGPRVGPVQFMHYFRMGLGDTAARNAVQADADRNVVVQHFQNLAIAVSATRPFAAHCSSTKPGVESPTKTAMHAGRVGLFPQAIGRVDFAVAFEPVVAPQWQTTLVMAGGTSPDAACTSAARVLAGSFESAVSRANARVADELSDAGPCPLPDLAEAYQRAVISLHDLFDEAHGTFIAAPEFDPGYELSGGYGYCWPRDAAVCALAMQQIGRTEKARRFFDWSARTQLPSGHWYQRYWTDGSLAPSWCVREGEIQLDQTCAIVHAAGLFARRLGRATESFVRAYRPTAERATRAILQSIGPDGLHLPATDLWENSLGTFAYTQAAVIAALREACEVFDLSPAATGPAVQAALRDRLIGTFWNADRRRWLRHITPDGQPDATLDSSAMGLVDPWSVLDVTQPADRLLAIGTLDGISRDLRSSVKGGGAILRFQGESYMGGGPGCVNTLWLALCRLRLAATAADPLERRDQRARAMEDVRVALSNTSPTGQLPELIPKVRFDYWAAPHAWACALLIEVVIALRSLDPANSAFHDPRAQVKRRAPSR